MALVFLALAAVPAPGAAAGPAEVFPRFTLIAHALGGVDGETYTNSVEAFEHAAVSGFRWFEVDVEITADGRPACVHPGFERHLGLPRPLVELPLERFLAARFDGRFTPLTLPALLRRIEALADGRLVVDLPPFTDAALAAVEAAVAECGAGVRGRLFLEVGWPDEIARIRRAERERGRFGGVVYGAHEAMLPDREIEALARSSPVEAVTLPTWRFSPVLAERLHAAGAAVAVHTVNDRLEIARLAAAGADAVMTDFATPPAEGAP